MKDPFDRTKVVLRLLPPAISQATLMEEIDGAQFKVHVEYAPSQHVPKTWSKKDVREGTIIKDPEYLEFLEHLAKPAENLPSAEIQLERREAERAGGQKDMVIVTPLMEFVQQKRVAKSGSQVSGGSSRNVSSVKKSGLCAFKQNQRHEANGRIVRSILSNKDGCQSYVTASQSEQQTATGNLEKDKHPPPPNMCSMLKVHIARKPPLASIYDSEGKNSPDDKVAGNNLNGVIFTGEKHNGRTRNKYRPDRAVWARHHHSDGSHADDETLSSCSVPAQRSSCSSESISLSQEVAGVKAGDDDVACIGRLNNPSACYDIPTSPGHIKAHMSNANRTAEVKTCGGGRISLFSAENGSHRYIGRRGPVHGMKEVDASLNYHEGKPSKRGGPAGYGSHERQVWVQKSGSGT
ncbi:hypothetical protein COCNU_01G021250 [Cocos nucifera]|uniref:UPF3 domain-containing protein n=1 Tax=Cocos nucifera TaxID=13894 RepID=A0A8K0HWT7_COCNU|nr:hypothetical protein COCNU_01G021250 [Cocos nucifera]